MAAMPVSLTVPQRLLRGWSLVAATAVYALCSGSLEFINSVFIIQYRFTFPAFIALSQALLTILVLELLRCFRLLKIQPYLLETGEKLLIPSICFSFHSVLTLWAVSSSNLKIFMFIRRFTPLASLALTATCNLRKRTSCSRFFLILLVTICSVLSGLEYFDLKGIVCLYGFISIMFESTYLTLIQKIGEDCEKSAMDIYYICTINSCPMLFLYCVLHPDSSQIFPSGSWNSLIFLGYFALVLVLGCLLNFFIYLCALLKSALMANMMEVAKINVMTLKTIATHQRMTSSVPLLISVLISAGGLGTYMYQDSRDKPLRKETEGILI
ncbi:UDP-galactose/UDP-glucose transporter 7 [Callorhinchus milii]|uniref:Solute carrier family 35 member D3 n=1 Tax=Callorhinchus milii TaxID=7868 RepID=V9KWQ9_CALMI|nr:UDP-galactose/UDP-glucose transporter 7 [Callorhinchus milii]|eukprot:gi/632936682/ref/XP_007895721.1/ PREDICTED: solute carrier family 35 member D3-like [Callorhinchus milii]